MKPFIRKVGFQVLARRNEVREIDAGGEALGFKKVNKVLGRHIADGAGRERASAEPTQCSIEPPHTFLECGMNIR